MSSLTESIGKTVIDRSNSKVRVSKINAQFIGVFVSRITCPPCVAFLKELKKFYKTINENDDEFDDDKKTFEIIFCSQDLTEQDFENYFYEHQSDWLAVTYQNSDIRKQIRELHDIKTVPYLLIFDGKTHKLISRDGRIDIPKMPVDKILNKWTRNLEFTN